ncbi:MAG: BMP family ABC transporter substrate-binding protein [Negativicutes bacterium]
MKKNCAIVVLLICALLSGCGVSDTAKADKTKVGLILNFCGSTDKGRNQSADGGLHAAYRDFGNNIETKMFETAANNENEEYLLRLLAANDYKLVFLFDNELGGRLPQIAAVYPNTRFVRLDSIYQSAIGNLQEVDFDEQSAGLAAGVLAGLTSKTGKIGFVDYSAENNQSRYEQAFLRGIKETNRTCELVAITKEELAALQKPEPAKTKPAIDQKSNAAKKVDVIFVNGMYADQLALINSYLTQPVKIITCGANPLADLTKAQSRLVLAAVFKNTGAVLYNIVKQNLNGKFQTGVVHYGLDNGMDVQINDDSGGLTAEQKVLYEKIRKNLINNQQGAVNK